VSIGAATMKIISKTKSTSTNGVILISLITARLLPFFFGEENAKDDLAKFHHKYSIVSNRNPLNQSMIPPRFLWRRLQSIDDDRFLISLAKTVEW
jgi:hypothetical protein